MNFALHLEQLNGSISLHYNKVDFAASKFEATLSLQIEARGKIKGVAKLFGQKTLEISFPKGTFKNLTTLTVYALGSIF